MGQGRRRKRRRKKRRRLFASDVKEIKKAGTWIKDRYGFNKEYSKFKPYNFVRHQEEVSKKHFKKCQSKNTQKLCL